MARGLTFFDSDDFTAEVSFDDGVSYDEIISTAWVETEGDPESDTVTALGMREFVETGDRPVQTIAVGMDIPALSDPTFDRLLKLSDDGDSARFRVKGKKRELLDTTGTSKTLAIAAADGVLTFIPSSDETAFIANRRYVPGLFILIGSDYFALKKNKATGEVVAVAVTAVMAAGIVPAHHQMGTGFSAAAAESYTLFYPGVMRAPFNASVTTGGALNLATGNRAQTSINLTPDARFDQRLLYTV